MRETASGRSQAPLNVTSSLDAARELGIRDAQGPFSSCRYQGGILPQAVGEAGHGVEPTPVDGERAHAMEGRGLAIDGAGGRPGGASGELVLADLIRVGLASELTSSGASTTDVMLALPPTS